MAQRHPVHPGARPGRHRHLADGGEWEISTPAGVRKPDVFVVPRETARAAIIEESPKLIPGAELLTVAEMISPGSGSERADRLRKVSEYASLGIPQYWIVEHTPRPSVQVLLLTGEAYAAASLGGVFSSAIASGRHMPLRLRNDGWLSRCIEGGPVLLNLVRSGVCTCGSGGEAA